jgi:hypothetical protein
MKSFLRRTKASKSTLRKVEAITRRGHRQTRRSMFAANRFALGERMGYAG